MHAVSLRFGSEPLEVSRDVDFSGRSLSVGEFWEGYRDSLPVIIKVQEGFMGAHWFDEIATGQIYWITSSKTQMRVVAKDDLHGYISIPIDYPLQLQTQHKIFQNLMGQQGKAKTGTIREIIETCTLPVRVKLVASAQIEFLMTTDRTTRTKFDQLELVKTYEERYLIGNSIVSDKIYTDAICALPMYLPIKVKVGASQTGSTSVAALHLITLHNKLKEISRKINYTIYPINKDIMVFSQDDISSSDGTYEYIAPRKLVSYQNLKRTLEAKHRPKPEPKPYEDLIPSNDAGLYEDVKPSKMNEYVKEPLYSNRKGWSQIPKDTTKLTVSQLAECLVLLKMEKYVPAFEENQIDGRLLKEMEPEDLQEMFQMNKFMAKKLCLFVRGEWRPGET